MRIRAARIFSLVLTVGLGFRSRVAGAVWPGAALPAPRASGGAAGAGGTARPRGRTANSQGPAANAQGPTPPTPRRRPTAPPTDAVNSEIEPTAPNQRLLTIEEALELGYKQSRELLAAREHLRGAYSDVERVRAALLPTVTAQGKLTINVPEVSLTLDQSGAVFSSALQGAQILDLQGNSTMRGPNAGKRFYTAYCQNTNPNRTIPGGVLQACAALANPQLGNLDQALSSANIVATIVPQVQLDGVLAANIPIVVPAAYPALSAAKYTFRAQEKQLEVTTVQVLQGVATSFYQAAGYEEVVVARLNAIGVAQKTLTDAKIRLSAGVANRVDVTRAEQAVVKAKQDLLEAQGSRGTAYRNLATLLKIRAGSFKIVPPPETPPDSGSDSDSQVVSAAQSQRPELANLDLSIRASGEQVRSSWLKWAPTLSGFGNIRLTNATGFAGRLDYYALGLQLDWQIFDGFIRDSQRHQFEAQGRENTLRLELFREQVTDEVLIARSNILIRRRGLVAAQSSVRLAKEALDLVRIQYEAGTATQLDLLTAQDKLVQADVGLAQARFDVSLAALTLRKAVGEPLSGGAISLK